MKIAIIGAGAAGFFTAINLRELTSDVSVTIYESSSKVLSKVYVSGGGRCNLTNSFEEIKSLSTVYPRGEKLMKGAFKLFNHNDTYNWFEDNGVKLVTQSDCCVFPQSQDSQEIIDTFLDLSDEFGIKIKTSSQIRSIEREAEGFRLILDNTEQPTDIYDAVVVTTGGSPKREGFNMLSSLPLDIIDPVPSLFSFNIPNDPITDLMGTVVENVSVKLQGVKSKATGALLVTHWGVSGPAILKLSSYAARILKERDYNAKLSINWVAESIEKRVHAELTYIIERNSQKLLSSIRPYNLPSRLWLELLKRADVSEERRWAELGIKGINRIVNVLTNDEYEISGKSNFKDEFVTCGGVSLESINPVTMESKECPNLYLAGEVLDIDAITGGFNLQAAWSTGYVVAKSIADKVNNC